MNWKTSVAVVATSLLFWSQAAAQTPGPSGSGPGSP
jgi:hypothetical protein